MSSLNILILLAAFIIGSIPTSVVLVRLICRKDIRKLGSGNPGATNVYRTCGPKLGIAVLLLDAAKGLLPVYYFTGLCEWGSAASGAGLIVGVASILGHVFSPFLGFKGGKGVATSAGVGIAVAPVSFSVAFGVWLAILVVTKYMSIASIAGVLVFFVVRLASAGFYDFVTLTSLALSLFIIWTHRSNLRRLSKGTESKINQK